MNNFEIIINYQDISLTIVKKIILLRYFMNNFEIIINYQDISLTIVK